MGHSSPKRTVWKFLIFRFPSCFTFFSIHKKLFLLNFEICLITALKDFKFRFFAHNFFKNGPNSNFFFWNFCLFFLTYFLEKKIPKNYLKCFLMRFMSLNILILFLKPNVLSIFLIFFYFKLLFFLQILRSGW